jgi:tRNA-2-methylthio-N6-dimethylallyladenosine synthase
MDYDKKYFIETFGCQMNEFDSEKIRYMLEGIGYTSSERPEKSDIIIINTCAVREKAKNRLYGHIGRLKELKYKRADLIICVGGCSAQNLREKIITDFKFVDIVFGTHNIFELPKLINKIKRGTKNICSIKEEGEDDYKIDGAKRKDGFKSLIPISIGCNNFCSYCIVPYVRGREKSIMPSNILSTIDGLVKKGTVEVTLLGQNVNSYGLDLNSHYRFSDLLSDVASIKGLNRIRFMTSHPKDLSKDVIKVISKYDNICNHIHLPIQSGSDKILNLMNRKYSQKKYLEIIKDIRNKIPSCSLTTDIIVGFPGELREDFLETLKVVKEVRFNRAFTFIYSKREGTEASKMKDVVPLSEKKEWFNELVEVQNNISFMENKNLVGKKLKVLVECVTNNGMLKSRLEDNSIVLLKKEKGLLGKILDASIKEARNFYLLGEKI